MTGRDGWSGQLDTTRAEAWTIGLMFALTLGLRLYILPDRWINPDEGAHLMDAVLALHGFVPEVDFVARQPFYVYVMAGFFKVTGVSLATGRLFPLICSLLVGWPLYLLTRELFGRSEALLALAAWWLLPFEIRASSVVKTEPFAMLVAVSSVYAAVRAVERRSAVSWMLAAGMLAAAGFYIRESALVIPPVILVYMLFRNGRRMGATVRDFGIFLAGYAAVCLLAGLFFMRWEGAVAFVTFTPVQFVAKALRSVTTDLPGASVESLTGTSYAYGENASEYLRSVKDGVFFQLFLIVGTGFAGLSWLWSWRRSPAGHSDTYDADDGGRWRAAIALAIAWALLLAAAYAWHFSQRGFWVDYSREFAPALILAVVGWLPLVAPALKQRSSAMRLVAVAVVLGTLWIVFQQRYRSFYGIGHHASLGLVLFLLAWHVRELTGRPRTLYAAGMGLIAALIVGARYTPLATIVSGPGGTLLTVALAVGFAGWTLRRSGRSAVRGLLRSIPLGLVVGAAVVTLSYGALRFNVKYQGLWSPTALADVTHYLTETTSPEDRVMSGGVVWELNAQRLPWGLYSHPMVIQRVLPAKESRALTDAFKADPPAVIVMDGITERTFGPNIQQLDAILATYYELVMEPEPVTFDVKVYRRIPPSARP